MTTPQPTTPARSFVRDVFVNVLANLIAAAIIYLGAIIGGLLRPNKVLTPIAALLLLVALGGFWSQLRDLRLSDRTTRRDKIVKWGLVISYGVVAAMFIFVLIGVSI